MALGMMLRVGAPFDAARPAGWQGEKMGSIESFVGDDDGNDEYEDDEVNDDDDDTLDADSVDSDHPDPIDSLDAAIARIWALYDAGVPLFSREALCRLDRQLDKVPGVRAGMNNTTVRVRGLDGRRVRLTTQAGTVEPSAVHPDIVLVQTRPHIEYWPLEKLTGDGRWHVRHFRPACALLPLRIGHRLEARYRDPVDGTMSAHGSRSVRDLASRLAAASGGGGAAEREATEKHTASTPTTPIEADIHMLPSLPALLPPTSSSYPPPLAAADIKQLLQMEHVNWTASAHATALRATLCEALRDGPPVRRIVCFSGGSISDASLRDRSRRAIQHAMLLGLRDIVEQAQHATPLLFAQEPDYWPEDTAALAAVGVTVLDDPHGFLAVDSTTLVVTVAPGVPVRQIVADMARPVAMIWTHVPAEGLPPEMPDQVHDRGGWTDPASPRVVAMLQHDYAEYPFPQDDQNFGVSGGMAVYVRKRRSPAVSLAAGGLLQQLRHKLSCQWPA